MKLFPILFSTLFLAGLFQGCSTSRQIPGDITDTYYGFLPCADCPGISYVLELSKNGQYDLTMDYYERESTFTSDGKFTYENNRINLYTDDRITSQFEVEGDKLISLDGDGNRIQTNLAPHYNLYKGDPSKAEMPEKFGRDNSQLIYKGTGNEPFWLVQVTTENTLKFKGLMENGEIEFEIPVSNTRLSDDNQAIIYSGKDDSHQLEVQIINQACQDGMSGHHFASTLEVDFTSNGKKQKLKGCGEFQNEYRLNGVWGVNKINGQAVLDNAPTLGIYLPEGRIAGSTSCNRYFGSIETNTDQTMKFGQVGATKMACADMTMESKYLNLLNQNDIEWEIDDEGQLILSSNVGNFVFSRATNL